MLGLGARPALLGWGRVLVAAADFSAADFSRRILRRSFDTALPNFGPNYAILRLKPYAQDSVFRKTPCMADARLQTAICH